jgi:hypothetical protein
VSANRKPNVAPLSLLRLSKATLVDLVWELAAYAAETVDDDASKGEAIFQAAKIISAPSADRRILAQLGASLSVPRDRDAPAVDHG